MTAVEQVAWIIDRFEGSIFTEDRIDAGGATKYGVTLRTLQHYRRLCTGNRTLVLAPADVEALTRDEAVDCIVHVFAMESGLGCIDHELLRFAAIDYAIHSGWVPATRALQRGLGVAADGIWGRITAGAVERALEPRALAAGIVAARQALILDLWDRKPSQVKFVKGWMRRTTRVLALVTGMEQF